jgi:phosphoribosylformimino-5-aminoimidazole carboxamide ribotide isomerase
MLIPSIDLMGGKIVQLIQGQKKALEFDNFEEWIRRFEPFPLVQLIDLDAAGGTGNNTNLMQSFLKRLTCQVGGGIRTVAKARAMLGAGARRVILGSALVENGQINAALAQEFANEFGPDKLVFAIDAHGGRVAIQGWRQITGITPLQMIERLEPFCGAFLYTHIDTEGLMTTLPLEPVRELRQATQKQLIVAGGISSHQEIAQLHNLKIDAVVGMAVYTGLLKLPYTIPVSHSQ